jgi:uncharacterized protein YpuA (DUF1002 family)
VGKIKSRIKRASRSEKLQKIVRNLQKFQKITRNEQKLHQIGAFWTVIELPPCANDRAKNAGHFWLIVRSS